VEDLVVTGLVAETPAALGELSSRIHDRWFRLDDVEYVRARREVSIPLVLGAEQRGRLGWRSIVMGTEPAGALCVREVAQLEIADPEGVGEYEVDRLTVARSGAGLVVRLHATIPLRIDFIVDRLEVEFVPPPLLTVVHAP
jgi:hypothetical protein